MPSVLLKNLSIASTSNICKFSLIYFAFSSTVSLNSDIPTLGLSRNSVKCLQSVSQGGLLKNLSIAPTSNICKFSLMYFAFSSTVSLNSDIPTIGLSRSSQLNTFNLLARLVYLKIFLLLPYQIFVNSL